MLDPSELAAPFMNQGAALYGQGQLAEAREQFSAALDHQPDLTTAKFNLAVVARDLDEDDAAETLFREVIGSGEIVAEAVNNLGILASRRDQTEQAIAHFREAIRLREPFPLAHFNLSTVLLRQGNWAEGWPEYEWRWQTPTFRPIGCPQPQWNGDRLDGTLLLHTEQGIGDVFQFCRFIPMIRQRCRRVMFLRPEAIGCMFPQEQWADEIRSPGEFALDSFDAFLPLMSAPLALGLTQKDLPAGEAYLTPPHREVSLPGNGDDSFKVGLAWRGSPTHSNDRHRSMDVRQFAPLMKIPGVSFYSLQVGEAAEDLTCDPVLRERVVDLNAVQRDFADTAAIVQQLDLVITVDTSVLHLSGGLGLPVWGLISRRSDWRWLSDGVASDWYPSLTLFRQKTLGDWKELIGRVADQLAARVA